MPSPSYWPLLAASGAPIMAYGQIYRLWAITAVGVVVLLGGLYAWALEPSTEPPDPDDEPHGPPALAAPSPTAAAELAAVGATGGGEPALPGGDTFTPAGTEELDD
jgi:hypothetical protein